MNFKSCNEQQERFIMNPMYSVGVTTFAFITNHGLVLLSIAKDPHVRMRDIASTVDITERAAQRIVADLIDAGYVDRTRVGRRNAYAVRTDLPISLPSQGNVQLGSLLGVLMRSGSGARRRERLATG